MALHPMAHRDAPIVLFTIYGCPYCREAVKFLKSNPGLRFKANNIGNDARAMTNLAQSTGSPTVPKIFVQGQFIGGYGELMQLAESGELQRRLAQPMA